METYDNALHELVFFITVNTGPSRSYSITLTMISEASNTVTMQCSFL